LKSQYHLAKKMKKCLVCLCVLVSLCFFSDKDSDKILMLGYYTGTLDDVFVFNRVISKDETKVIMGGFASLLAVEPNSKLASTRGKLKSIKKRLYFSYKSIIILS